LKGDWKTSPDAVFTSINDGGVATVADIIMPRLFPYAQRYLTAGAIKLVRTNQRADCSKAKQELGYQPTSIGQAVVEAYTDFVQRGLIVKPRRILVSQAIPSQPTATEIGIK
jgi:dihydroflavonol-4-reductase